MKYYLVNIETSEHLELKDKLSIGRKSICDIILQDDLVSGRHCRFHIIQRAIYIEDLNASNPVQINNVEMNSKSRVKLKNKDKLKVGSIQFYISNKQSNEDSTYKSMILEKVKIHETFESDLDYEKHQEYWNDLASKKKSEVIKIQKRLTKVTTKKEKIDTLNIEIDKINKELESLNQKAKDTKNYTENEIIEKIDYFTEKISFFTQKRDEILAVQILNNKQRELESKKIALSSKINTLSENDVKKEHEELSKLHQTEINALSAINEKLKK